jgi:hypothetical protein
MVRFRTVVSDAPKWWAIRHAENLKPVTYVCPFCEELLPALKPHVLVLPEGDVRRRRHAHAECAMAEKRAGRLPSREQYESTQPSRPGRFSRLLQRTRTR